MTGTENLRASPSKGNEVFIAETARVTGNVHLGDHASVWYGAVIRGDAEKISIGEGSNIQDNAVVHADPGFPAITGKNCTIGHSAVLHGAILSDHVLLGIHCTVLNGAEIGEYSIIAANALVTEGCKIPPFSLVMGVPGKVVKTMDEKMQEKIRRNAESYIQLASLYLKENIR